MGGIFGPNYTQCLEDIKREYITATALASMIGCILMGVMANLPIALAPGMGMNAYFTYTVVGWRGTGGVGYEAAVTAVVIEGAIFLVLAVTGARYAIIKLIPEPVKIATPAGIGAFLAHLGLQTAEGIGAVVSDIATAVTLGACVSSAKPDGRRGCIHQADVLTFFVCFPTPGVAS
jgi:adenine/guanine/hypoxanthine permease